MDLVKLLETHQQVLVEGLLFPQWAADPHFNPYLRATWRKWSGDIVVTREKEFVNDDGFIKALNEPIFSANGDMEVAFEKAQEFISELASKMSTQWNIFEMFQTVVHHKIGKPYVSEIRIHGVPYGYPIKETTVFLRPLDNEEDEDTDLQRGFCPLATVYQVDYDVDLVDIANTVRVFYTCIVDGIVLNAETTVFPQRYRYRRA